MRERTLAGLLAAVCLFAASSAAAAVPSSVPAVAEVFCEGRSGSGTLINAVDGYLATAGHVAMDIAARRNAASCQVGFVDGNGDPKTFYQAGVSAAVFDPRTDRDYAVLKLGPRISGPPAALPAAVRTNEFAAAGDAVTAVGFPGGDDVQQSSAGAIISFERGIMSVSSPIAQGYSGGPALDAAGNMVGIAKRVSFEVDPDTGAQTAFSYEFGDVMAFINWLDEMGPHEHAKYLTHADAARFDAAPYVIRDEGPGCAHLVRTTASPTVYCLHDGPERLVFPNEAVYFSWYPDFSQVKLITPENLAEYALIGNMTMKAGSLVKIQTDPRVYLVVDAIGGIRWVQTEARASELFGPGWASMVRDVPDAFFVDYRLRDPVP